MDKYNTQEEIWKDIEGYEGIYLISNLGRVKSLYGKGRIRAQTPDKDGYLKVGLYKNAKQKNAIVSRLVAKAFIEGEKEQVNHIDGDKKNNRVSNLEWVDNQENIDHAWDTGLYTLERQMMRPSKLDKDKVIEIRESYSKGERSYGELAKLYDVSKSLIADVVKRRCWKHI